eukprot:PITA_32896
MNGIKRQHTTTYTPQQNAIAERKNRTVVEMARCMLQTKGLSKSYWGDVVSIAVYILNCNPTSALENMTPYEACETSKAYKLYNRLTNKLIVSRDVIFDEGGVYGHQKGRVEKKKSILNDDIIVDNDHEQPTNVSVTSGLTPPSNPSSISSTSSSSPTSSPSSTREVRRLSDIYERSANQAHEESPIGEIVNFAILAKADFEPSCFEDASTNEVWMQAMKEEMDSIQRNDTWKLTELPHVKKKIGTKWVYKTKFNNVGSVERHKERLVAKGFTHKYRIDYEERFAQVAREETIRMLISLAAHKKWSIHHMDVKSAFLNGYLEEEVYVERTQGFEVEGKDNNVYKLKKALYGLKQAPRG